MLNDEIEDALLSARGLIEADLSGQPYSAAEAEAILVRVNGALTLREAEAETRA